MNSSENKKLTLIIFLSLAVLMAATRFPSIGSAVGLHNASLAVFFLSGFYLRSIFFPLFFAEAALIDYAAFMGGQSDWCFTPAYLFLIPTYAALWWAGRWYVSWYRPVWRTLIPLGLALFASASLAFVISNVSFYRFSGYFVEMGFGQYAAEVAEYYPPYVARSFFYIAFVVGFHLLAELLGRSKRFFARPVPGASR